MRSPRIDTDVTDETPNVETALELYRAAVQEANDAADAANAGTDLALLNEDADAVKKRLTQAHATVARARQQVIAAKQKVRDEIERARRHAQEMERRIAEELGPLEQQVARLQDGISAINLYLGRDEYIHAIRSGAPAAATEPVHIRQTVLAMDEEAALVNLHYGGIDFQDIDKFDEWILDDPANLDQVLPEQRGVVAIMARRADVRTGNAWEDDARNKENHHTWFLIRNGENLYRVLAEGFTVGARLIPKVDEFTSMFTDHKGEPLQPGSSQWLTAEKVADLRTRHYMKIALVLQGLVARTAVFHPLPTPDLNLLTQHHFEQGFVRLITDDENTIDTGRPSYDQWLRSVNENIRVGARIIGDFDSYHSRNQHWDGRDRTYPKYVGRPTSTDVRVLARNTGPGEFSFPYKGSLSYRDDEINASFRVHVADQDFLAIDFVNREDLRYYLESRSERRTYLKAFPVLRAALDFLDREAAEEAPFRALLRSEVAKALGQQPEDTDETIDELIRWWKVANKWNRSLNGDQEAEAKAARNIVKEALRRKKAAANAHVEDALVETIRGISGNIIAVARRTSDWVSVEAHRPKYFTPKSDRNRWGATTVSGNVFVTLRFHNRKGEVTETREWATVDRSQVGRWHLLFSTPEWENWNIDAKHETHLTDADVDAIRDAVLALAEERGIRVAGIQFQSRSNADTGSLGMRGRVFAFPRSIAYPVEGNELTGKSDRHVNSAEYAFRVNPETLNIRLDERSYSSSQWSQRVQHARFEDERATDEKPAGSVVNPWDRSNYAHEMIWVSPELPEMHRVYLDFEERIGPRSVLEARAQRVEDRLVRSYLDCEEARAHARFIEDYADEALWEDHKKSLRIPHPTKLNGWEWYKVVHAIRQKGRSPRGHQRPPVRGRVRRAGPRRTPERAPPH